MTVLRATNDRVQSPRNRALPFTREDLLAQVQPEPMSGCWLWTGSLTPNGYGAYYRVTTGGVQTAHRAAYILFKGPIPDGLHVDHKCRTRCCCNPDHLELVTTQENTRRGEKAQRTHCVAGHAFDEANTYLRKNGTRMCRACAGRRHRARRIADFGGAA